ncbi:MAG: VOC family protein [Clostridiales bacterium]|nr:VOC family protein [Clostridiales bacterium]
MKYCGAVLSVEDVNLSRKFYEELFGLEVFQDYGINISFSGGLSLQQDFARLLGFPKGKTLNEPHNMELCFEEEDFDGFVKKLGQLPGLRFLHGVREHGWGQRVIRFYDPDGHLIEVGENMKMVVARFLAAGLSMQETAQRMDVSVTALEVLLRA